MRRAALRLLDGPLRLSEFRAAWGDPRERGRGWEARAPAPFCHALRKQVRKALWEAYGMFFAAYRVAAEKLKEGDWTAVFPPGSFPPRLPVVTA